MKRSASFMLLTLMIFCSCTKEKGTHGLSENINTNVLKYRTSEKGKILSLQYSDAVKEISGDGVPEICLCRAVGFRISQIISNLWEDCVFRTYEISSITTGWNTEGPYEFFQETLEMPKEKIIIAPGSASHDDLAIKDCWYSFTLRDGTIVTLKGKKEIFGEFIDLRAQIHKGEKGIQKRGRESRTGAEKILATLPFNGMFEISIKKGGKS